MKQLLFVFLLAISSFGQIVSSWLPATGDGWASSTGANNKSQWLELNGESQIAWMVFQYPTIDKNNIDSAFLILYPSKITAGGKLEIFALTNSIDKEALISKISELSYNTSAIDTSLLTQVNNEDKALSLNVTSAVKSTSFYGFVVKYSKQLTLSSKEGPFGPALLINRKLDAASQILGSIDSSHIKTNMITSTHIKDETIATIDIQDNAITSAKVGDNEITSADIKNGTIIDEDIASVGWNKLTGAKTLGWDSIINKPSISLTGHKHLGDSLEPASIKFPSSGKLAMSHWEFTLDSDGDTDFPLDNSSAIKNAIPSNAAIVQLNAVIERSSAPEEWETATTFGTTPSTLQSSIQIRYAFNATNKLQILHSSNYNGKKIRVFCTYIIP